MSDNHFNPLHQFDVSHAVFHFSLFGKSMCLSYSTSVMLVSVFLMILIMHLSVRKLSVYKIGRFQAGMEYLISIANNMLQSGIGRKLRKEDYKYAKYIFCLFLFIITLNIIGLIPYGFAPTAQLSVTLALGLTVTFITLSISIKNHGIKFLKIFIPDGVPVALKPLIFILELFSYFVRPLSLAIRLGANMIAGHVMIEVIAFMVLSSSLYVAIGPFLFLVGLNIIEIGIAILQAYIFSILSSAYIGDAYHH